MPEKDLDGQKEETNSENVVRRIGKTYGSSGRWLGYGVELAGVIGFFAYIGYLADQKFETKPWLTVTGILIAMVGMFYLLFKELIQDK